MQIIIHKKNKFITLKKIQKIENITNLVCEGNVGQEWHNGRNGRSGGCGSNDRAHQKPKKNPQRLCNNTSSATNQTK